MGDNIGLGLKFVMAIHVFADLEIGSCFSSLPSVLRIIKSFFQCLYRFGNTAYLYISVVFIQMLKALSM